VNHFTPTEIFMYNVRDVGCVALAEALKVDTLVRCVNLGGNNIGDAGCTVWY
jgi:hypothetical protein